MGRQASWLYLHFFLVFFTANLSCQHGQVVESQRGVVASAHPLASEAGLAQLRAGGNAVDAAVATSFALAVLRPQSTGLGGGGFWLNFDAKSKAVHAYDFRERAPLAASPDLYVDEAGNIKDYVYQGQRLPEASANGHLAVGVPGLVAGLVKIHQERGRLPLAEVVAPAIKLASEGFLVYPALAEATQHRLSVLNAFPGSRALFSPKGEGLAAGDWLVQQDLANTLRAIATHGADGFYQGEVGTKLLAELADGGINRGDDFDSYQVKMRKPLVGHYRGNIVVSMPPPSSGGAHLIQMLNMLEEVDLAHTGPGERSHLMVEAMKRAFADRATYMADPEFVLVPIERITSKAYAKAQFSSISEFATPSSTIRSAQVGLKESSSTTHISVVDAFGNAVSTTQTINYFFGSGVVARGTGVVLNDEMNDFSVQKGHPNMFHVVSRSDANAVEPGKTMLSSMTPTMIFDRNSRLSLILGSPGGPRIINATLQCIVNVVDLKMPLPDAINAPRIHHQWLPDVTVIEKEHPLPFSMQEVLRAKGHTLEENTFPIGDVEAIIRTQDGWVGASDPRSDGEPRGL